jgi:hypothetical protein
MARLVLIANCLPMTLLPIKMKGIFTNMIKSGSGISKMVVRRSAMPVAPPSIKSLGRRNPLSPKAAENIPTAE